MLKTLVIKLATNIIRTILVNNRQDFRFKKCNYLNLPNINETGIYVHVPFCAQICPYCPYNSIPYNEKLAKQYIQAVIKEIDFYAQRFPKVIIKSVYFGGGTPTILSEGLLDIIIALKECFKLDGPICIETNPADLTAEKIEILKTGGVHSVSLGVQSFNHKLLQLIGRKYSPEVAKNVLTWLEKAKFQTVNVDLMFALPRQTLNDLKNDLEIITNTFVDQITNYPLFTFPYSSVGEYRRLKNVEMPKTSLRKRMYFLIHDYLTQKGYNRVSVWSFKKYRETPRYSSVTRERYIGFGPGAGSYYGPLFTLNTFSVQEYITSIRKRGHAVALEMTFCKELSIVYDFYWRLYDTYIPKTRKLDNLSYKIESIKNLYHLIMFAKFLGFIEDAGENFILTKEGAFWIHLLQNYFSLRYINTIWTVAKRIPWPESIKF